MSGGDLMNAGETPIKVLVVDDRPENVFAMETILRGLPVQVVTAGSGHEALRKILHHEFAVALLDVQMPEMDGFETAMLMREDEAHRQLPIIFVTAISKEQKFVFQGYDSGAVDYLFKPIDARVLVAKVRVFVELWQSKQDVKSTHEKLRKEIVERERIEVELRLAQKLEAVGQLAAGIAHEINTPIQYIGDNTQFLGTAFDAYKEVFGHFSELLAAARAADLFSERILVIEQAMEEGGLDYLTEHVPKAVEQTLEGVQRVAKIVLAMKEFSHPGLDKMEPVDINRALETTVTVAKNEWKYVAEVQVDLDRSLPRVSGLGGELNQVFLNILVNAAHAIKEVGEKKKSGKGTIRISTSRDGSWVEVRISDTGTGIPEGIRHRIFDPFFTTKEVGKGTGQGLAMARSVIVDRHHGQIDMETECGKGTTFIIRLPIEGMAAFE